MDKIGLHLSESMKDDILDIVPCGGLEINVMTEVIRDSVKAFLLNSSQHRGATRHSNPILYWVALILEAE